MPESIELNDKDAAVVWRSSTGMFELVLPSHSEEDEVPEAIIYLASVIVLPNKFPELYNTVLDTVIGDATSEVSSK